MWELPFGAFTFEAMICRSQVTCGRLYKNIDRFRFYKEIYIHRLYKQGQVVQQYLQVHVFTKKQICTGYTNRCRFYKEIGMHRLYKQMQVVQKYEQLQVLHKYKQVQNVQKIFTVVCTQILGSGFTIYGRRLYTNILQVQALQNLLICSYTFFSFLLQYLQKVCMRNILAKKKSNKIYQPTIKKYHVY